MSIVNWGTLPIAFGQFTTVTAVDTVVTGLRNVTAVMASLDSDPLTTIGVVSASIGDQAGAPAAGSILIKGWSDVDVAAGVFGKKVNWVAFGN